MRMTTSLTPTEKAKMIEFFRLWNERDAKIAALVDEYKAKYAALDTDPRFTEPA